MIINRYELITRLLAYNELTEDYRTVVARMTDDELCSVFKVKAIRKGFYLI